MIRLVVVMFVTSLLGATGIGGDISNHEIDVHQIAVSFKSNV